MPTSSSRTGSGRYSRWTARPLVPSLLLLAGLFVGCSSSGSPEAEVDTAISSPAEAEPVETATTTTTGLEPSPIGATVIASSPGTISNIGLQRVLAAVRDGAGSYTGGADQPATMVMSPPDGSEEIEVPVEWVSAEHGELGLYTAYVEFPHAGVWSLRIRMADTLADAALYEVVAASATPQPGQPAPRSESVTAADVESLAEISTDADPDPSFYTMTIGEAVANGRPTIVMFTTPAFCETALCVPTTDLVKDATAGRDDIDVVHVEPFDIGQAMAGVKVPVEAMFEWGVVTEPWVFVVGADGNIVRSFEGIVSGPELADVIAELK